MESKTKGLGLGIVIVVLGALWFLAKGKPAEAADKDVPPKELPPELPEEIPPEVEKQGFTLSIASPPSSATHWSPHFYSEEEERFISPSPTPTINEIWDCPYNPYGATDLRIVVLDFVNKRTVHDASNLGQIHKGMSYIYNVATRTLHTVG